MFLPLLRILVQVTLLLLTAWRESHSATVHGHIDIPESHGKMVRWLDDEIPRNRIPTLKRDLLRVARDPRWVEAKVVCFEVESEKWRRLLLHQMCVAIDVATDGREEDFFPLNGK
ncbi:hypothetical protein Tco_1056039 [Tanacetum coccineum]|uniref:Uncharacterized protein n=1 Tax=Tanacetum coccineum TaxID=301880 RepID=A0ABQ5H3C4_9ASTR